MKPQEQLDPKLLVEANDRIGGRCMDIVNALVATKVPLDDLTWTAMALHVANRLTMHIINTIALEDARSTIIDAEVASVINESKTSTRMPPPEGKTIILPPPGMKV